MVICILHGTKWNVRTHVSIGDDEWMFDSSPTVLDSHTCRFRPGKHVINIGHQRSPINTPHAVAQDRVKMHKVRVNADGSFTKRRAWDLDDLKLIDGVSESSASHMRARVACPHTAHRATASSYCSSRRCTGG